MQWEENGKQGLALNTKAINIVWGGEGSKGRYWRQTTVTDEEGPSQVVELVGVYWLELKGKVPLNLLDAGTTYKFFVTLKLTSHASGWGSAPVIFRLYLSGETAKSAAVDLSAYLSDEWFDLPDGGLDFTVPHDDRAGTVSFAMFEFYGEEWKKGLVVKEVKFVPQPIVRTII